MAPDDALPKGADLGMLVRRGLAAAVRLVDEHDPVIRGATGEEQAEAVHQARVGCRRLRSDLRTFGAAVEDGWRDDLRAEVAWLADELGAVRDLDVLLVRFRRQVAELRRDDDRDAAEALLAAVGSERDRALARLRRDLDGRRYRRLRTRLDDAVAAPAFTALAEEPARKAAPDLVARPWRKLRTAMRDLGREPSDEAAHAARIRLKRVRYAAMAAEPAVGKRAGKLARELGELQDLLGEQHDAVVAEQRLRALAARLPRPQALVAGELIVAEQVEAAALLERVHPTWRGLDRASLVAWLER